MNSWLSIFRQSPANNAPYNGDRLPQQVWRWPADTWFQSRVRYVRQRHNESRWGNRPARWSR
ncbi:MAG TPA: hypothetical protein VJQ55_03890 [Candidatus Binatia bacterium]|nr:hypothetical protein [Candidatus Binatia bacterium]